MNHDAAHCWDYKESCPESCYRAQLTKELREIKYPFSVGYCRFKGTEECPIGQVEDDSFD